jgi:hypothetical protein
VHRDRNRLSRDSWRRKRPKNVPTNKLFRLNEHPTFWDGRRSIKP